MTPSPAGPRSRRTLAGLALVGLSGAWNAGNVGPVANEIADEFDLSLAVVGLLAGTFFLGPVVLGLLVAAQIGERVGLVVALRGACATLVLGNLIFALTPVFVGLAVGRVLPGLAYSLILVLGAVWAREAGGAFLLGVFGASIMFGIALALLVGSALSDLDVDWRVGFVVSAALGAVAFATVPAKAQVPPPDQQSIVGFLAAAVRHARVYRLALLFMSIYGVSLILSTWLVQYLFDDGGLTKILAGLAAFLLFALSALTRIFGARLQQRGVPHLVLGGALVLAAIGLAALVLDPVEATAFASVVLLALGLGVPYATALIEAQQLAPSAPSGPVALMTFVGLVPPIVAIPIIGHALDNGEGALAFGILAAFLVVATLLNLRRTGIPVRPRPRPQRAVTR